MICQLHDVDVTFTIRDSEDDVLSVITHHADLIELDVDRGVTLMGVSGMYVDSFDDDWVVLRKRASVNGADVIVDAKLGAPLIAVAFDILDFHMTHR